MSEPDKPLAVFVGGPPGAGKSTLGRALARRLRAALIDQDTATGPLTAVVLDLLGSSDLDDPAVTRRTRAPRYETLLDLALDNARCGMACVLVAPFTAERDADRWQAATARLASVARPVLVWMTAPPELLAARIAARGAPRDLGKHAAPDPPESASWLLPTAPHLLLDATRPGSVLAREVISHLTT